MRKSAKVNKKDGNGCSPILEGINFRDLYDSIDDVLFVIDKDYNIIYANKAFKTFAGKDCINKKCHKLVHNSNKHIKGCPFAKAKRTGKTETLEYFHPKLKKWWLITANPVKSKGKIIACAHYVKDITKKKKSEEELNASETQYRTFINNLKGIAYKSRLNPPIPLFFRGAVKDITGYTEKDFIKRHPRWDKMIHPDDFKEMKKDWQRIAKVKNYSLEREYRIKRKDGKQVWLFERARNICNGKGKPEFIEGILYDITEKKKVEEELQFKDYVFEGSLAANSTAGLDGKLNFLNPNFLKVWGYKKKSECLGKPIAYFFKHAKEAKMILDSLNKTGVYSGDFTGKKKDGSLFTARTLATAVKDDKGNVIGYQSAVEDVTDRITAETNLIKSEEKFRKIIESTPMGIHLYSLEQNDRLVFSGYNPAANKILGINCKQFIGKTMERAFPPLKKTDLPKAYRRVAKTGKPFYTEQVNYEYGKISGAYEVNVFRTEPGKIAVMFTEVTEKLRVQRELTDAYKELKSVDELKSNILRDVSHELKTPSAIITMTNELLSDELRRDYPDASKISRYVSTIDRNAVLFTKHINAITELSWLESTKKLKRTPMKLKNVVKKVVEDLMEEAELKGLKIEMVEEVCPVLSCNKMMMETLFRNLVSNAIKFTDKGKITFSCRQPDGFLTISVKDTGIGISAANQKKLFKPFSQVDPSYEGMGVGLAICKKIAELHNAEISVKSSLGKGSEFILQFKVGDKNA